MLNNFFAKQYSFVKNKNDLFMTLSFSFKKNNKKTIKNTLRTINN